MSASFATASRAEAKKVFSETPTNARIASLLPGLTDVVHDLNFTSSLVANSHECTTILRSSSVTSPKLPLPSPLPSHEIAAGWNAAQSSHPLFSPSVPSVDTLLSSRVCSFYRLDISRLAESKPTLLLTHLAKPRGFDDPDESAVRAILEARIPTLKTIISADVRTLNDVFRLHRRLARDLGQPEAAVAPVAEARGRLESIRAFADAERRRAGGDRPRVAIVQWADPLYLAGDWVPAVALLAGAGGDGFTTEGGPSVPVPVEDLKGVDVVVFAVCAVRMQACKRILKEFLSRNETRLRGWKGRLVVTDATTLFSRPSLSAVVQSAEVVAEIVLRKACYGHREVLWDEWEAE